MMANGFSRTPCLWNMTEGKTRATILYIENLRLPMPEDCYNEMSLQRFKEMKKKALEKETANAMLQSIGYRPNRPPRIFERFIRKTEAKA